METENHRAVQPRRSLGDGARTSRGKDIVSTHQQSRDPSPPNKWRSWKTMLLQYYANIRRPAHTRGKGPVCTIGWPSGGVSNWLLERVRSEVA